MHLGRSLCHTDGDTTHTEIADYQRSYSLACALCVLLARRTVNRTVISSTCVPRAVVGAQHVHVYNSGCERLHVADVSTGKRKRANSNG
jgi:ABC-type nickel/cobalt efflux system permease component RcnA